MIHWFSVDNYRSVRDKVKLDFRVPGTTPMLPCFRTSASKKGIRLPTVVVFIGPNGSGKTTLLRAIAEVIDFAANSYRQSHTSVDTGFLPFFDQEMSNQPTRIELEFDAALSSSEGRTATLCHYILEIDRNNGTKIFAYEALLTSPKGRPRRILERRPNKPVYVAKELGLRQSDKLLSSIPANASAISTLARMGVEPFLKITTDLGNTQRNITYQPEPWKQDLETLVRFYQDHPEVASRVSDKLPRFNLGIEGMDIFSSNGSEPHLRFKRSGLDAPIIFQNESGGTRHLATVFPQLNYALETEGLAIMDSLDSGFHTNLLAEILDWFRRNDTNPNGAQLICSLHNISLLRELEKEEVFIVEKDQSGRTNAYGVREVQGLRRSQDIHKWYRSGALGGLPMFG